MSIRLYCLLVAVVFLIRIEGKPVVTGKLAQRINHLINITNAEVEYNNTIETYLNTELPFQNLKNEARSFFNSFFSFQSIRPKIVQLYGEYYTLSDINGLIKFYSTPLGKKHVAVEIKLEARIENLFKEYIIKMAPQMTAWFKEKLNVDLSENDINNAFISTDDD